MRPSVLLLFLTVLSGCGKTDDNGKLQPVVPVTLKVTHKGKPLEDAEVVLHPVSKEAEDKWPARPRGVSDPAGIVKLSSFKTDDGAPEGNYVATVIASPLFRKDGEEEVRGKDRLGGRFASPKVSRLRVTVSKGDAGPLPLSLD